MKVLVLPSWFPSPYSPLDGSFFLEQSSYLAQHVERLDILAIKLRNVKTFKLSKIGEYDESFLNGEIFHRYVWRMPFFYVSILQRYNLFSLTKKYTKELTLYAQKYGEPDIVQVHSMLYAGMMSKVIKSIFPDAKLVVVEHSSEFFKGRLTKMHLAKVKQSYKYVDHIVAVSKSLLNALPLPEEKPASVIYNPVSPSFFPRSKSVFSHDKQWRVLVVSNFTKNKNLLRLVSAFSKMDGDVHLDIVGNGPQYLEVQKAVYQAVLGGASISLLGSISRNEVAELMRKSDAFALLSIVEPFGVVFIEALATGIPVIAGLGSGGPDEIITPEVGYLVDPKNEEAIFAGLREMFVNRQHWWESRQKISSSCYLKFSEVNFCQQHIQLFEALKGDISA